MEMMYTLYVDAPSQSRYRWISSLLLFPLCVYFCLKQGEPTVLDAAAGMLHQAGSTLFGSLGELGPYVGGPLLQVLLPCILILFFYFHRFCFGVQVFLFWLGQGLIHMSFYIRDARHHEERLLDDVGRSWYYLLDQTYLLEYSPFIGFGFYMTAALCFFTLLILPRYMIR